MTPLHFGAKMGYNDVVNFLLSVKNINPNARTNSGWTPLHMSAMKGHNGISSILCAHEGTDIKARDNKGNLPLHYAAQGGYVDITRLLLSKGTDINVTNNNGETPMHLAVKNERLEAVEFIIAQNDYNLSIRDSADKTAFEYASGEIKEVFVKQFPELGANDKKKTKCRI